MKIKKIDIEVFGFTENNVKKLYFAIKHIPFHKAQSKKLGKIFVELFEKIGQSFDDISVKKEKDELDKIFEKKYKLVPPTIKK